MRACGGRDARAHVANSILLPAAQLEAYDAQEHQIDFCITL